MRAHIEAVKARLETSGRQVYLVDVPEGVAPTFPYFLVWSTTGDEVSDALDDAGYIDSQVGVTNVGLTPESVWAVSKISRGLLTGWAPTIAGRHVHPFRRPEARGVQADRDVTLPNSNRHPYFGVDLYQLVSEPAPAESSSSEESSNG